MITLKKAALLESIVTTILICVFAKQFCGLFGITGGAALETSIVAVRIVSLGFMFCSAVSLMTSYYMLIDRIGMSTCFSCLQNGLFYIFLPIAGALLFGMNGMWAGFAVAPMLTFIIVLGFVFLRFGKDSYPFLLNDTDSEIFPHREAYRAALFVEEIGLTILEKNKQHKKPILIEFSLFFENDSVLIIERDSGMIHRVTHEGTSFRKETE